MKNIFDKKKDPINYQLYQNFISCVDFESIRSDMIDSIYNQVVFRLKSQFPTLETECKEMIESMKLHLEGFVETRKFMLDKTAKIIDSNAICEDVYQMRDKINVLSKILHDFKNSIQKIFPVQKDDAYEDEDDEDY
jgi:hypothetical protein